MHSEPNQGRCGCAPENNWQLVMVGQTPKHRRSLLQGGSCGARTWTDALSFSITLCSAYFNRLFQRWCQCTTVGGTTRQ